MNVTELLTLCVFFLLSAKEFYQVPSLFIVQLLQTFRVAMFLRAEPLYILSYDYQHSFHPIT